MRNEQIKEVEQKVKSAITKLSFSKLSPIFTNLILMTKIKYTDNNEIPFAIAGVQPRSDGIILYINVDVVKDLPLSAVTSVIAHEYWHIVNGHCWSSLPNKIADNVAADLEINQQPYVRLDNINCGNTSCIDKVFSEIALTYDKYDLPGGKSREYYYERLPRCSGGNFGGKGEEKKEDGGDNKQKRGQGQDQDQGQDQGQGRGQDQNQNQDIKIDTHDIWDSSETQNSKEIYRRIVQEILQHAKSKGTLPGDVIEEIEARWRKNKTLETILKRIVGKHYRDSLNETVTRTRPSRRNPLLPGTKDSYGPSFVIAIDTSGSMSTAMLEQLISVFKWLTKKFGPTPLIQCDAKVHEVMEDISRKTIVPIKGRGGTSFEPVFKFIEEKFKNKIDVLIFGTDLNGTFPKEKPPYKVYWVVPEDVDDDIKPPFGTVVKL